MGKFKIGINFDKFFLNKLSKENNSGVIIQNTKHHLALHPIHLNNFNKSIKDLLSNGIAKFDKNLNGILLGYENVKLLSNMGVINNDSPYVHYDLVADFYVFKPEIDKVIKGIVNRKSKDHVGLLVYNTFNVSIPKPQNTENWLGNSVNIGYDVEFKITFIDFSSYLPYIKGELMSIISEVETGVSDTPKNKKIIFEAEDEQQPSKKKRKLETGNEELTPKKSKKKKEKQKNKQDGDMLLAELNVLFNEPEQSDYSPEKDEHTKRKKAKERIEEK